MPEPLLYLEAMGAAAIASTLLVLAMAVTGRPATTAQRNATCVAAIGLGLVLGYAVLALGLTWPPANGLDRLLWIVVPASLGIEWVAGFRTVPRWLAWSVRIAFATTIPIILLHNSVYLSADRSEWTQTQTVVTIGASGMVLSGVWALLTWLWRRSPGVSIPLAIVMSTQCAGMTVMMAGYIKGGAAAFPFVATIGAVAIGAKMTSKRTRDFGACGIVGMGIVGLFGLLFIGRFFGRLSTGSALVMLLAPLLCWASEVRIVHLRRPWMVAALRLLLVAIPLTIVLALAKQDFDRDMAPLLGAPGNIGADSLLDQPFVVGSWPSLQQSVLASDDWGNE